MKEKTISLLITSIFFLLLFQNVVIAEENPELSSEKSFPSVSDFVPGEILVQLNDEKISENKLASILVDTYGGISVETKETPGILKVAVEKGNELNYCKNIKKEPSIKYAEPNYISYVFKTPNDPMFNQQWGPDKIKCPDGWEYTTGDSDVSIAIIDTGVDYTHPDLADNCIQGYDFVNININKYLQQGFIKDENEDYTIRDNDPMDINGHGTHCAGITSAVSNNNIGISGVAWDCKIMPVRAGFSLFWEYESVTYNIGVFEDEDIIDAIDYAADNGADVISMSFGSSTASSLVESVCKDAWNKGSVLVASTGNDYRGTAGYPARYEKVIGVGAINEENRRCDFSNYGAGLSLVAPGEDILSTLPESSYGELSGTSMACPHVAGVAALAFSRFTNYNNQQVIDLLEDSADYIGPALHYGHGRVDATFEISAPPETEEIIVTINIDFVEALDNIDIASKNGEWYYEIRVYDDYDNPTQIQKQVRYNKEYASWIPFGWNSTEKWVVEDGIHQFTAYDNQAYVDVSLILYEWDGLSLKDIADISACTNEDEDWTWVSQKLEGREYLVRYYLDDDRISTIVNPCEDKIVDGNYLIANGEVDESQGEETWDKKREDDAKIRYDISDNYIAPHSPGLDIIGFHKTTSSEWIEPGEELEFIVTVAGGAVPYTWELSFGDETKIEIQTNSDELHTNHVYSLKNGETRVLTKPKIWVKDRLGEYTQKYYPTSVGMYITNPPDKPEGGRKGFFKFWTKSEDFEGDMIYYVFNWKTGSSTRAPSYGYLESNNGVEVFKKSSATVVAIDEYGAISEEKTLNFSNFPSIISLLRKLIELL